MNIVNIQAADSKIICLSSAFFVIRHSVKSTDEQMITVALKAVWNQIRDIVLFVRCAIAESAIQHLAWPRQKLTMPLKQMKCGKSTCKMVSAIRLKSNQKEKLLRNVK